MHKIKMLQEKKQQSTTDPWKTLGLGHHPHPLYPAESPKSTYNSGLPPNLISNNLLLTQSLTNNTVD